MELINFKPLPKDLRGWNGNSRVFKQLIEEVKPKLIVEVGSWKGQSTVTMAKAIKELGLDTKIQCVDTWLGAVEFYTEPTPERDLLKLHGYPQVYYQFISNLVHEKVEDIVETLPMPSRMGAEVCNMADLIYIDASHEYVDVIEDIQNYWLKLNENGIMFGDDYSNIRFAGVKRAVDEFSKDKNLEVFDNWFWIIRKP